MSWTRQNQIVVTDGVLGGQLKSMPRKRRAKRTTQRIRSMPRSPKVLCFSKTLDHMQVYNMVFSILHDPKLTKLYSFCVW